MVTFQVSWEFFILKKQKCMYIYFSDFTFNKLPPNTIRKVLEVLTDTKYPPNVLGIFSECFPKNPFSSYASSSPYV
jgi:hypothetical protein